MRWFAKYHNDETRVRHRFLWWPLRINNETRWLEWAYVEEYYMSMYNQWGTRRFVTIKEWVDYRYKAGKGIED